MMIDVSMGLHEGMQINQSEQEKVKRERERGGRETEI